MSDTTAVQAAPLDNIMLAMDVVDTLRHRQDLALRELDEAAREKQLIEKLRSIYQQQGIEVTDAILKEGVAALKESRFVYTPPAPGLGTTLARLYVSRERWGRWVAALAIAAIAVLGGYFLVWRPYDEARSEAARAELSETLPTEMDALYQAIYDETKVQQAAIEAETLRNRGKAFAAEGNREAALDVVARLTTIRDTLRQQYTLRVVNREGVPSGIWAYPEINTDATNYYIIVEALDPEGQALSLPIRNEENGDTETVSMWGVRVPETVYNSVAADKRDDGIIQRDEIGRKSDGFLEVEYAVPVLGGTLTRW